jgi:hypothetical protein
MKCVIHFKVSAIMQTVLLIAVVGVALFSVLSLAGGRDKITGHTTTEVLNQAELNFTKFYSFNLGPGKHELTNAFRELVWNNNQSTLSLNLSPLTVARDHLSGCECQTINGRDFYFRDVVAYGKGTTKIVGTDIITGPDISTPMYREIIWKTDLYRYSLQAAPFPYDADQAARIASAENAMRIESNNYYRLPGYSLDEERWNIHLIYDGASVNLIFVPLPFAESELSRFIHDNKNPVQQGGKVYYQLDDEAPGPDVLLRALAWQTDRGLFLLYCQVSYRQSKTAAVSQRSFFDYGLAEHISLQIDAHILPA